MNIVFEKPSKSFYIIFGIISIILIAILFLNSKINNSDSIESEVNEIKEIESIKEKPNPDLIISTNQTLLANEQISSWFPLSIALIISIILFHVILYQLFSST